ncbi:MAG: YraN family protein [Verrucomicrobiota bacterium]
MRIRDEHGTLRRLSSQEIGQLGERTAARAFERAHGSVLWRNYRARAGGEVDLVGRHQDVLIFAEVKTRTSYRFGAPSEAVDEEKQRLIQRGALDWLRRLDFPQVLFRFDIFEVRLRDGHRPDIHWIENAFQLPDDVWV